jgi:hypothetical protein
MRSSDFQLAELFESDQMDYALAFLTKMHRRQGLYCRAEIEQDFPYREMFGSLVFLQTMTRFDISAAVSIVSKYLNKSKKIYCDMIRRIYSYLRGTKDLKLCYDKEGKVELFGYCDASFANLEN